MCAHLSDTEEHVKEKLRAHFRAQRSALSEEAYACKSAAIIRRVRALPEVEAARVVHCYWPHVGRREVDTRPLIDALHADGRQVVLPVITAFEGAPALEHRRYAGRDALAANRWGLREPVGTETVPPEALDLIVVPAFGAGRNGHRIGYGFGYYDTFLRSLDAATVGLIYEACLVDEVTAEAHDVPLDVLVTETETVRPR